MDELTQNYERGDQTDIIILDFSKAFDMVPRPDNSGAKEKRNPFDFLFKIVEDMIPAILKENYLVQLRNKRRI